MLLINLFIIAAVIAAILFLLKGYVDRRTKDYYDLATKLVLDAGTIERLIPDWIKIYTETGIQEELDNFSSKGVVEWDCHFYPEYVAVICYIYISDSEYEEYVNWKFDYKTGDKIDG